MLGSVKVWCLLLLLSSNLGGNGESQGKNNLPCDEVQKCLNAGSRDCWKKFHEEGSKRQDLIADVLKVFPQADFMHLVDEAESEMWPEFYQLDKNLTDCMSDAGYKNHVDFCSNMRSTKFSSEMEKAIEEAEKEQRQAAGRLRERRDTEGSNKCWVVAMKACTDKYDRPEKKIDDELQNCENTSNAVHVEERLGFEVGKRVMLKMVAKIKEAFDNSTLGANTNIGDKHVTEENAAHSLVNMG